MRKLIYILIFLFFAMTAQAATYSAYFSDDATGNAVGTDTPVALTDCSDGTVAATTCKTLAHAQTYLDLATSADTVNLYFDKSDTWSMNTDAVSTTLVYGLTIDDTDPIVNIDAYGAGNKPIFDGTVSDFSTVPVHDATNGPLAWNRIFQFNNDGSSVKNIKINGVYGNAIQVGGNNDPADNFTLSGCDITNFGYNAVVASSNYSTQNTTITKNLIHTGEQLYRYGRDGTAQWAAAIAMAPTPGSSRNPTGNTVSYNVIYDIGGEGISGTGTTIEYNIIGDTGSVAIYPSPQSNDGQNTIIRYNLITQSSSTTYTNLTNMAQDGIMINDENSGGVNSGATVEVYGNIVINRNIGIAFSDNEGWNDPWAEVRIYNNTVIDSVTWNFYLADFDNVASGKGYWENNTSLLYDRTGDIQALDYLNPATLTTYWTIDNNSFWDATAGGGGTVDADWQTNYVVTDPKLNGESTPINWDGLASGDPRSVIAFSDVYPLLTSSLIGAGKTLSSYDLTFLTLGSDFSVLPSTQTFATSEQSDLVAYDIGAAIRSLSYGMSPVNGDTGISLTKDLSWTNQGDTTNVDVYWDKNNPPTTKVVSASLVTTYDTGTMDENSTYYYRVDPLNSLSERETGVVISFTTTGGPPQVTSTKRGGKFSSSGGAIKFSSSGVGVK